MNIIPMIKVKLPNPAHYSCSPSGDSEYEDAYKKAINEYVPSELVIIDPTKGQSWPKDNEGYTYIPVRCASTIDPLTYYMNMANKFQKELEDLKKKLKNLVS